MTYRLGRDPYLLAFGIDAILKTYVINLDRAVATYHRRQRDGGGINLLNVSLEWNGQIPKIHRTSLMRTSELLFEESTQTISF